MAAPNRVAPVVKRRRAPRVESLVVPKVADLASTSEALVGLLEELGVEHAFGVVGGAIAPFCEALARSDIRYLHFRHETGAAFAALEASLARERPTVVFVTNGPGVTNALTGVLAARWDGGRVLLVSAATSPAQRGRWAAQETSAYAFPTAGVLSAGALFHFAHGVEHPNELAEIAARLRAGFARPEGFVAHLSLPISIQAAPARRAKVVLRPTLPPAPDEATVARTLDELSGSRFAIWLGFGARHASAEARRLAAVTGAAVVCSPRAKGVFPEDHPAFVGVTGVGGHATVDAFFARERPEHVLVLGTRLGEGTSFWSPVLEPTRGFVHVDVDADAIGVAYPHVPTLAIVSEIRAFARALAARWDAPPIAWGALEGLPAPEPVAPREQGPVRPQAVMAAVQRAFVDDGEAIVLSESGNAFAWANHHLRFTRPNRYRVSPGFGSMGHASAGVVGAAIALGGKAVAIVGDGAMLMQSEISSAVEHEAAAVWVVLNDARYGMPHQGMEALGWAPFGTRIPRADFVALARAVGADGATVTNEDELEDALARAKEAEVPFVVDVLVDPDERAPSGRRNESLLSQGRGE